jgi:hypothetical protein
MGKRLFAEQDGGQGDKRLYCEDQRVRDVGRCSASLYTRSVTLVGSNNDTDQKSVGCSNFGSASPELNINQGDTFITE